MTIPSTDRRTGKAPAPGSSQQPHGHKQAWPTTAAITIATMAGRSAITATATAGNGRQ